MTQSISELLEGKQRTLRAVCALALRSNATISFDYQITKGEFDPDKGWLGGRIEFCRIQWPREVGAGAPSKIDVGSKEAFDKLAAEATESDILDVLNRWKYHPPVFGPIGAVRKSAPDWRSHWVVCEPLSRDETNTVISKVGSLPEGQFYRDPKVKGILGGRWLQVSAWDWWFFQDKTITNQGQNAFKPCPICGGEVSSCDRGPKLAPLPCPYCGHL